MKKIAIMTAGGDCAGLNSVIKTVVLSAEKNGITVVGVLDGYKGFIEKKYTVLTGKMVENIDSIGGTILGSSNKECPFHYPSKEDKNVYIDRTDEGIEGLRALGVDSMIVIGGDGTLDSARVIHEHGLNCIGIPKTIDNDMSASDPTIGFDTAVEAATECIERVRTTAYSHRRVMVVETMGRTSGYLTLYAGFASSADVILLPEIEYNLDIVANKVKSVMESEKRCCIVVVSEAAKEKGKAEVIKKIVEDSFEQKRYGGVSERLAESLEKMTGYEARNVVLGHIQRGGAPSVSDSILASRLGGFAMSLLLKNEFGKIVGIKNGNLEKMDFPKDRVPRLLNVKENDIIVTARNMGVCFGDM
ncbi:MAG: ATP-dependent 6-phosphofructokinase [Clostridia bacterium]|nr:ATP-dependent 6-phosphofructokinase [Clostridia bacterium]